MVIKHTTLQENMCIRSRYRSTRFLFISHLYLINVENRFIDYTRLLKVMKLIQEGFIFYKIIILHEHRIATHGMMVYLIPRCCFLLKSTWHGHELLSSDSAPQQVSSNTPRRKGLKQGLIKKSITIHLCKTILQNNCFVSS